MSKIRSVISRLSSVALLIATMLPLTALAETPVSAVATTMQEFDDSMCANIAVGTSFTLTDARGDNKSYTIAKLADDNCWMTQNLALGSTTADLTLTPSDSNITSGSFIIPTTAVQTSGEDSWGDASNSSNAKHVYATGNTTYGNYYNWYTATAGTGVGTMSSTSASDLDNATDSICPKGWRLPDGGTSATKSWYALDVALDGTGANRTDTTQRDKFISSPYNFPYSGYYNYGSGVANQDSRGYWWSRSAHTTAGQAYDLTLGTNGNVFPQNNGNVGYGFAVRCVLDNPGPPAGETTITANVDEVISLRLVSTGSLNDKTLICRSEADPNCSGEEQLVNTTLLPSQDDKTSMYTEAYVSTNSLGGYTLVLSDSDTTNALTTASTEDTIAAINREPVGGTYPGWAIAIDDDDANWAGSWYQVPISTAAALPLKTSSNPGAVTINARTKVTYGVAASSSQPTGTYTDTVVYTATAL